MRGRARGVAALSVVVLLSQAATARGDAEIAAAPVDSYASSNVSMDQGERLTFYNGDISDRHNVVADRAGPDGRPLFDTPIIDPGKRVFVAGSQYLTTGTYDFYCTVHSFMTGTLTVTANGTPEHRPGDTTPAKLRLSIVSSKLDKVVEKGRLSVAVTVDEKAKVDLTALAKAGGHKALFTPASASFTGPGTATVKLRLTKKGKKTLRDKHKAKVTLVGHAKDRAGNPSKAEAHRTLKRS